jgi:hypothetical protein
MDANTKRLLYRLFTGAAFVGYGLMLLVAIFIFGLLGYAVLSHFHVL